MTSLVVRGRRVLLADGIRPAVIHVRDGRIARIESAHDGRVDVDAGESLVIPGLVDTHVHVNEPGRTHWEGFETATRAAAAGGVTTLMDMPLNSVPATTTVAGLRAKQAATEGKCWVDVALWGGVVPGNTAELEPLAAGGVRGFKCFLSPSGVDEFPHVQERDLREALPVLARLRLPLLAHAELPGQLIEPSGDARRHETWLRSRPREAEHAAIELLIALAREYGARVHIVHLASADAVPMLRSARADGVLMTVETCPHYLTFAAEEIPDGATAVKCAPPVREGDQREKLWRALASGDVDLVATDHSPSPPDLKHLDDGDFLRAWGGIASLQIGFAAVWTGAAHRGIGIEPVVRWMSSAPARLGGLDGMKGAISPGADADLVILDPDAGFRVEPGALHHRHPVTAYAGMTLRGVVETTILRGEIVYRDGEVLPGAKGKVIGSLR